MTRRTGALVAALVAVGVCAAWFTSSRAAALTASEPQVIDDAKLKAVTTTEGGADVLPSTRTVAHWWGSALNPHDGLTYGYNMVGANPFICAGAACTVTVEVDITPIVVNVAGRTFDGTNVLAATLASPQFDVNNYGTTPFATAGLANIPRGPGGPLSQDDNVLQLQLQDATMRAQFNKTGTSSYHLYLHPNVLPAVTINVPQNQGTLLQSGPGVIFADVNIVWWSSQIQNLITKADPTHLALYLTDDVLLFTGKDVLNCCVIGYHGTRASGNGNGSSNSLRAAKRRHRVGAPGHRFAMGTNLFRQGPNPNGTRSADGFYYPEDEVLLGWFMRTAPNTVAEPTQTPSANIGRYTLMGDLNPFPGFRVPATGCQ